MKLRKGIIILKWKAMNRKKIVQKVIEEFKQRGGLDIIKFAQNLGIDVYYKKSIVSLLKSFSNDFNAKILFSQERKKYEIYVNPFHPVTRQRFSVAHELAHYILHRDLIGANKDGIARKGKKENPGKLEKEADELAAELLMPQEIVDEFLKKKGYQKDGFLEDDLVREAAEHFRVSLLMAILRLRNLNYPVPYVEFA